MTSILNCRVLDRSTHRGGDQAVVKIDTSRGAVVVKRFGRRRTRVREALIQIGHWTFAGKTRIAPERRCRTEREALLLWARHGFDVPRLVNLDLDPLIRGPYVVLEYLPGRTVHDVLADPAVTEHDKLRFLARFSAAWGRRHALAIETREPRLIHEHGSFRHVLVSGERLVTFDFEIGWTRKGIVPYLVGREIASFVRSLARVSAGAFEARLAALLREYPDHALFREATQCVVRARNPIRWLSLRIERFTRRGSATSKLRLLADTDEALRSFAPGA